MRLILYLDFETSGLNIFVDHIGQFGLLAHQMRHGKWRLRLETVARKGVCTMDLYIQPWFQKVFGKTLEQGEKTLVMSLTNSVDMFYMDDAHARDLMANIHSACADAQLHVLLYQALRDLASRAATSPGGIAVTTTKP